MHSDALRQSTIPFRGLAWRPSIMLDTAQRVHGADQARQENAASRAHTFFSMGSMRATGPSALSSSLRHWMAFLKTSSTSAASSGVLKSSLLLTAMPYCSHSLHTSQLGNCISFASNCSCWAYVPRVMQLSRVRDRPCKQQEHALDQESQHPPAAEAEDDDRVEVLVLHEAQDLIDVLAQVAAASAPAATPAPAAAAPCQMKRGSCSANCEG